MQSWYDSGRAVKTVSINFIKSNTDRKRKKMGDGKTTRHPSKFDTQ